MESQATCLPRCSCFVSASLGRQWRGYTRFVSFTMMAVPLSLYIYSWVFIFFLGSFFVTVPTVSALVDRTMLSARLVSKACAHFGGICMGTDIDVRVLKGKRGRNIFTNFGELCEGPSLAVVSTREMPLSLSLSLDRSRRCLTDIVQLTTSVRVRARLSVGMQNRT